LYGRELWFGANAVERGLLGGLGLKVEHDKTEFSLQGRRIRALKAGDEVLIADVTFELSTNSTLLSLA